MGTPLSYALFQRVSRRLSSKPVAQLKDALIASPFAATARVLTDLTGDFNRVVLEYQADNIGAFEAGMRDYATNEAFRNKMKGYTDLYITGSREILQIA